LFRSLSIILLFVIPLTGGCNDFFTKDITIAGGSETSRTDEGDDDDGSDTESGRSTDVDNDADGLFSEVETSFGLSDSRADGDEDGVADGLEFVSETGDPLNADESPTPFTTRTRFLFPDEVIFDAGDSDLDGLGDQFETRAGTEIRNPDSDGDGYEDGLEFVAASDPLDASSIPVRNEAPVSDGGLRSGSSPADSDGDGISDEIEALQGTATTDSDSDDDGFSDGIEFLIGSDGNDAQSVPTFFR